MFMDKNKIIEILSKPHYRQYLEILEIIDFLKQDNTEIVDKNKFFKNNNVAVACIDALPNGVMLYSANIFENYNEKIGPEDVMFMDKEIPEYMKNKLFEKMLKIGVDK